jgi:hypothetical protein
VLAGAGPLYRGRLEALWSCLESMLLDGDLEVGGEGSCGEVQGSQSLPQRSRVGGWCTGFGRELHGAVSPAL